MIKARGDGIVLLGLSRMNVERLLADMPIHFDGSEVGLPGIRFIICGGETEQSIEQQLRESGMISTSTVIDDRWGDRRP